MPQPFSRLALPLLTKELIEQSARRRTYVIRVVYALLLFSAAVAFSYDKLSASTISPLAILGTGRDLFLAITMLGFGGIYLFMPAITCSVISQEKERASLQLLFLTRLGPWTIVFEKLAGRMIPMLGFLLLSLPLLAFAYTLGGVSQESLWTGVWLLFLTTVQMGTLAVACSAFCRTTVSSFVASYVIGFLMLLGPYFAGAILLVVASLFGFDSQAFLGNPGSPHFAFAFFGMMPLFGMMWFLLHVEVPGAIGAWPLLAHSLAVLSVSAICLALARRWLVSRASLRPRSSWFNVLKRIEERVFRGRLSAAPAGGPAETSAAQLPADEPVAWRETTKRVLGRPRYLLLILLVLETPLLLVQGLAFLAARQRTDIWIAFELVDLSWFLSWMLAILVVAVRAASLVAGERSHQTLDVLCTTPIAAREIVLQKMRGVRALIAFCAVPILTLAAFRPWWVETVHQRLPFAWTTNFNGSLYLACSALEVAVYLPLVAWVSLLASLAVRSQTRAIVVSLTVIVAVCAGPLVFLVTPLKTAYLGTPDGRQLVNWLSLTSPASIVIANHEALATEFDKPWLALGVNFAIYGGMLVVIRQVCLTYADRWLGRSQARGRARVPVPTDGDVRESMLEQDCVDASAEEISV